MWRIVNLGGRWQVETPSGVQPTVYASDREAVAVLASAWRSALVAAPGDPAEGAEDPDRAFCAVLCFENAATTDGRVFRTTEWRDLPLPWLTQFTNEGGHTGAQVTGRIDTITREAGTGGNAPRVLAQCVWDVTEEAQRARHLAQEAAMTGVSIDGGGDTMPELVCMGYDEDGFCNRFWEVYPTVQIMSATQVTTPAFAGAQLSLDAAAYPATSAPVAEDPPQEPENGAVADVFEVFFADESGTEPCTDCAEAQVAAGAPTAPPAEWFEAPEADGPTPLTVTDDGQVFGHIATWGTCHTGDPNACTLAPRSESGYAYFHTGEVVCADGSRVAVGRVSLGAGHAATDGRPPQAVLAHYDDTTTAAADVRAVDGVHGIWVAGALRPGLPEETVRAFRASPPSGDWRRIAGSLELLHVLAVNAPGFPVTRVLAASASRPDEVLALVAAGGRGLAAEVREPWRRAVRERDALIASLRATVDRHERLLAPLLDGIADSLVASVGGR